MFENSYDIAVIGGGAAGMMAGVAALRADHRLRVCVLEKQPRLGKKLMATGNGRCNLTNTRAGKGDYHGETDFIAHAMNAFPPDAVISRFEEIGVVPLIEPDGRVYPMSGQASSVLDCLRNALSALGAREICDFDAVSIKRRASQWLITSKDARTILADRVIVTCGGLAAPNLGGCTGGYRLLSSLGHEVRECLPALVQLKTDPQEVRALKGIRIDARADIFVGGRLIRSEVGDILFTDYGLSGIAIMQLSRAASVALAKKKPDEVFVELHALPWSYEKTRGYLERRRRGMIPYELNDFLTGMVSKRLGQVLIKRALSRPMTDSAADLTQGEINAIAAILTAWRIRVTGVMGFDQAQVTCGGVSARDFDQSTLESRLARGVYAAGEVLDVDGDCGGFNLQWAWASGILAGESAAKSLKEHGGEKH